jgi:hypothetical protein
VEVNDAVSEPAFVQERERDADVLRVLMSADAHDLPEDSVQGRPSPTAVTSTARLVAGGWGTGWGTVVAAAGMRLDKLTEAISPDGRSARPG